MPMNAANLGWIGVGILALASLFIFLACVRQRPTLSTTGTVKSLTFVPPEKYRPYAHGPITRGFRTMSAVEIPARYSVEVETPDAGVVRAAIPESQKDNFPIGTPVNIEYQVRGTLGWKRVYVMDMTRTEPSPPARIPVILQ